ncbi:MAG: DUF4058 family protein [Chloroflexi bacterium]|nr:DUF4058 family protein [Chloroflexota bacterium]
MNSPFPGMDPYLEDHNIWPGFHHSLAEEIKGRLNAKLGERYYADVELRTVGERIEIGAPHVMYPDVGVYESELREIAAVYEFETVVAATPAPLTRPSRKPGELKLRAVRVYLTGTNRLVTTIELLSPYNKRYSEGLREYQEKRARLVDSPVHLVEIDLLRGGDRPGPEVAEPPIDTDYVLLVNRYRGLQDRVSEIWPVALNEPLPLLPIPLLPPDADILLDLNAGMREIYQRGAYAKRIDYRAPLPPPPPRPVIAEWLGQLVGSHQ